MGDSLAVRTYRFPLDHPWWTLLLTLLVTAATVPGLGRLASTTDYRAYFGADNPELLAFDATQDRFELGETLVVGVEALQGDLFTPEHLQALRDFTVEGWTLPFAQRSHSLANHQQSRVDGDDILVEALVPDGEISGQRAAEIRAYALSSEELLNMYVAPDAKVAGIFVTSPLPRKDLEAEVPELADALRAMIDRYEARYPKLKFHPSGVIMLNDAIGQTTRYDIGHIFPLAYLTIFVGLILYFRALAPATLTMLVIVLSAMAGYGVAGWLGIVLTTASLASALIISTLAVADCVHLLVSWQAQLDAGSDKREAMLRALHLNAQPIFLTSLSTAVGFLSLEFADSPPFRDLGILVAAGVAVAMLASLFTLPALVMLLPVKCRARDARMSWPEKLADLTIRRSKGLLMLGFALLLVLGAGLTQNRFGDNPSQYFDDHIAFRADSDFLGERLTGLFDLRFVLSSEQPGGVNDPAFLQRVDAFRAWLTTQPETRKVISVVDLHKRLNQTMHADDPEWYRLPDNRELASQYLLFYELSLPQGLSLNSLIDIDRSRSLLVVLARSMDAGSMADFNARARAWLAENQPSWFFEPAGGSSIQLMFAGIAKRNFLSMLNGLAVAAVFIVIMMIVVMRSLRIGLISILPNLVPGIMAFGVWGLLVGKIGISLAVVGSMTLGIVVDDTIHFLSKYLRARREQQLSAEQAVRYAFATVGPALALTSVILLVGFTAISFSAFQLTSYMGLLTAITIGIALLADFLFLPPLLLWLDRDPRSAADTMPADAYGSTGVSAKNSTAA